ncbi:MAG: hypothetical protein QX189_10660 [Methylococcales bacterium]
MNPPKLPTIKSLEGFTLAYLLTGHRISHLQFLGDSNSYCLRVPVSTLRADGWKIEDCWNAGEISRFSGMRKKFKKYFFSDETINALHTQFGDRLRLFIEAVQQHDEATSRNPKSVELKGLPR